MHCVRNKFWSENKNLLFLILSIIICSCSAEYNLFKLRQELNVQLVDPLSTRETALLFYNLKNLPHDQFIFGHQHSTAYGVFWKGDSGRSDVKDVTGAFPGLYGWDFGDITNRPDSGNINFYRKLITEAYNRGGINIFAWHYNNPVTGKSFYDTTRVIEKILPGAEYHEKYKSDLQKIALFSNSLRGKNGELIPVIFRPFHEFDGNWFWWGKKFCTPDEFKSLWKFTVSYLRDSLNVSNFLFAFSPDRNFNNKKEYLERYPGDEFVDLLGVDNYWDFTSNGEGPEAVTKKLIIVSELAKERNKVAAFTETGSEKITDPFWWTDKLLKTISDDSIKIAFVMVWRNAHNKHYYVPFPGDVSSADFITFKNDNRVLFGDELPSMYTKN